MGNVNNSKIKNWDSLTISLLVVSLILIVFSFFAPSIFTKPASSDLFDFTGKGEIGDVIGGIMNPFIALVGVLLTFLAFYMQIKANHLQRELFINGLEAEKNKIAEAEAKEHITRLKVVKALINSITKYYRKNGDQLKEYIELEKKFPLKTNIFNSSTSSSYQNFMKIDLLETYNSLSFYFKDKEIDWEKDFIKVLDNLDFYDKMIKELRERYNSHVNKKFNILTETGEKLNAIMNDILVNSDLKDNTHNQAFFDNTIVEANFEKLQTDFLIPIIKDILQLFKDSGNPIFQNFIERLSYVNKKIGGEKFQALNHVNNFEEYYNNYFNTDDELRKIEEFNSLIDI
ncbi:MAG: hypothetical protein Q8K02_09350 [Flavobacterium sp.]|nr:hypothetical protein [Flavobacterium sp.]